jgi:hypothetical protein
MIGLTFGNNVVHLLYHYKVSTRHTPFQLVYGLYPLMLIEYSVCTFTQKGTTVNNPIWVLTSKISKLEKLEESYLEASESTRELQWKQTLWFQNHYCPKSFKLGDYVLWFPKGCK